MPEQLSDTQKRLLGRIEAERMFSDERIIEAYSKLDLKSLHKSLVEKMERRLLFFTIYRGFDTMHTLCTGYNVPIPSSEQLSAFLVAQLIGEQVFDDLLSTEGAKK